MTPMILVALGTAFLGSDDSASAPFEASVPGFGYASLIGASVPPEPTASYATLAPSTTIPPATIPPAPALPRRKDPSIQNVASAYVWSVGQSGRLAADGVRARAGDDLSDAFSGLGDSRGSANVEWVWRGADRTGAFLGLELLRLRSDDGESPGADLDTDHDQFEGAITWRLSPEDVRRGAEYSLDLLLGARWNDLKTKVRQESPAARGSQSFDWLEPFVGLRMEHQWKEQIQVWGRADLGGFGIGEAPDRVWHAVLAVEWQAAESWHALGGWRWERLELTRHGDRFDYDVRLQGPFLGVSYRY